MAEKMTKLVAFTKAAEFLTDAGETEVAEVVAREAALLAKRAEKGRGMTKTQKANVEFKAEMVEVLAEAGVGVTATELATVMSTDEETVTVQKVSALLRQLVAEGLVAKTEAQGKEKATFTAV